MISKAGNPSAVLLAQFDARLSSLVPPGFEPISDSRWSYREAAAVLQRFHPPSLLPADHTLVADNPHALLFDDIQPASGGRENQLYELKPQVRRTSLERLGTRDAMLVALDANPHRWQGEFQELYEAWLQGSPTPLEQQSYRQLGMSFEILKWLDGLLPGLPPIQDVRTLLNRSAVLASFEHLVTKVFVGRAKELQRLRDYVGVFPPDGLTESVIRQLRGWLGLTRRAPLVIHAVGGMGKSALVGRFLYEHAQLPDEQRFPFSYLALDNTALRVADPFTLVVESVAQLQLQFPALEQEFITFNEFVGGYRDRQGRLAERATSIQSQTGRLTEFDKTNTELYYQFGKLIHRLSLRKTPGEEIFAPALLVIDTFEEAQYRDQEKLLSLWQMLGVVQEAHPTLRVVISGRASVKAEIGGLTAEQLPLGELDTESAIQLLQAEGVEDNLIARNVANQIGGNPLTLQLAARALKADPLLSSASGIEGIKTRRFGLFSVSHEVIRGQLYRRVLDHIHDPDVRKLAHPGMIVRRVTAEIIREVLAGPCEMPVPDEVQANNLFYELRREHALVTLAADGSLHYRQEIRQPMLSLLNQTKPGQVRAMHAAAIAYYETSDLVRDRAEEIYHRLSLDQDPVELTVRWLEGCGDYLAESVSELPPRATAWLASRADFEVPREVFTNADLDDWERNVARKVLSLLRHQQVAPALALFAERSDRSPASPLFALEARVHLLQNDFARARQVLDQGLAASPATANLGRVAELLWMKAQTAVQTEDWVTAEQALEQADLVAAGMVKPLCRFQILTGLAQLLYARATCNKPSLGNACKNLLKAFKELPRWLAQLLHIRELSNQPTLAEVHVKLSQVFAQFFTGLKRLFHTQEIWNPMNWSDLCVGLKDAFAQLLMGFAECLQPPDKPSQTNISDVCQKLAEVFGQLDTQSLMFDPTLTRAALAVLGADYPSAFRRGLDIVGIGDIDVSSQDALREELETGLGKVMPRKLDGAALLAIDESHQHHMHLAKMAEILAAQGYSLAGANLAGIEDYRELWEIQTSPEVLA